MPSKPVITPYTCIRCLPALSQRHAPPIPSPRWLSSSSPLHTSESPARKLVEGNSASIETSISKRDSSPDVSNSISKNEPAQGAMSRRLAEATEDALLEGGRAGRRAIEDAGFSEELKARLLEKVQAQTFASENAAAISEAGLSPAAGRGTRDIAAAQAWTGFEAPEDTVLRMLSDAHKPLKPGMRGPSKLPVVDMRIKKDPKRSSGQRLANARDKTSVYSVSKDSEMSDKEREAWRREFKERFSPASRAMPNSIRGLQALANERIEDAIARGQFKNIPRGTSIVRDTRADNPFIDTTEYLMNKMIKRQDIVPPWIEKQQELVKTANIFRARLRNDWKRHVARSIAARGGALRDQIIMANRYAEAEMVHNPKTRAVEQISVPTNLTSDPVMITITQEPPNYPTSEPPLPVVEVSIDGSPQPIVTTNTSPLPADAVIETSPPASISASAAHLAPTTGTLVTPEINPSFEPLATPPLSPLPLPFRDPVWEKAEFSYLTLAIQNLNNITRSYNLMAPDLAKKPYFNLERELRSCYADVAPQVGQTIQDRATRPRKELVEEVGHRAGGVLERFAGETARVYDSKRPKYGFKEFWKDLWQKNKDIY
jgi:hypothetical protein